MSIRAVGAQFRRGGRNPFRLAFRGSTGGRTGEKYNDPRHGVLLIPRE